MLDALWILAHHITRREVPHGAELSRGLRAMQRADGGWGSATPLVYVALRLMGADPEDPLLSHARTSGDFDPRSADFLVRVWLAVLGLFEWEGVPATPPGLWIAPRWVPVHPRNLFPNARIVICGTTILSARRSRARLRSRRDALRQELYDGAWDEISFSDLLRGPAPAAVSRAVSAAWGLNEIRRLGAIEECVSLLEWEIEATQYASLSPTAGLLSAVALWFERPSTPIWANTLDAARGWLMGGDAPRVMMARTQSWETALSITALGMVEEAPSAVFDRAFMVLAGSQNLTENREPERWHRDPRLGGWGISDNHNQWPDTETTGEVLVALRTITRHTGRRIADRRLQMAASFLLLRQDGDGSFGRFERRRLVRMLPGFFPEDDQIPLQVDGGVCTTASALCGLIAFSELTTSTEGAWRAGLTRATHAGVRWLRAQQEPEGCWRGVNRFRATWAAVRALRWCGVSGDDPKIRSTVSWLLAKQAADGGWGTPLETAFAASTLCFAGGAPVRRLEAASAYLMQSQHDDGRWTMPRATSRADLRPSAGSFRSLLLLAMAMLDEALAAEQ